MFSNRLFCRGAAAVPLLLSDQGTGYGFSEKTLEVPVFHEICDYPSDYARTCLRRIEPDQSGAECGMVQGPILGADGRADSRTPAG